MKEWNIFKHTLAALVLAVAVNYLWGFATVHHAASIGIIGGADGPTSIFISGKGREAFYYPILKALLLASYPGIIAFAIIMILFKPVKRLLKSK